MASALAHRPLLAVVKKKVFEVAAPDKWLTEVERLVQFDREPEAFAEVLHEFPIRFSPTYPFSEGTDATKCGQCFICDIMYTWFARNARPKNHLMSCRRTMHDP
jgi:hypothetical protein